jgi:hypothetical protein
MKSWSRQGRAFSGVAERDPGQASMASARASSNSYRAPGHNPPAFKTCANAGSIARAFETSRRREALSFDHHSAVTNCGRDRHGKSWNSIVCTAPAGD